MESYYCSKKKANMENFAKIRQGKTEHKLVELPQMLYLAKIIG